MLAQIRRLLSRFFSNSRTINNEPLNKISLAIIILIDIFILFNVFAGLDDISRWHISPSQAYPCYFEWKNYQSQTLESKDYEIVRLALPPSTSNQTSFQIIYQQAAEEHLGNISETCLNYASYKDRINNSENQQTIKTIDRKQAQISTLDQANRNIRAQYDSTLLEKIAGQPREQSINLIGVEKAKQELDQNNRKFNTLEKEVSNSKNELVSKAESVSFLAFLKDKTKSREVEKGYRQASFWYASLQFALQFLFLMPLIIVALSVHKLAQRKGYGLISLISWHLLVIFFIPLLLKIFEFLQIGAIFQFIFSIVSALFGGLLFLISYVYILLLPLVGFGVIKFFQKVVFNPKVQAASRVQKSRCLKCAKKIRHHDTYCPHCGYYQYIECRNCHNLTYKHLPHCKECGYFQDISNV